MKECFILLLGFGRTIIFPTANLSKWFFITSSSNALHRLTWDLKWEQLVDSALIYFKYGNDV